MPNFVNVCHAGTLLSEELNAASGDANAVVDLTCREGTPVRFHQIILRKLCTAEKFQTCGGTESVDIPQRILLIIKDYIYAGATKEVVQKDVIPLFLASKFLGIQKLTGQLAQYLSWGEKYKTCLEKFGAGNIKENEWRHLNPFTEEPSKKGKQRVEQRPSTRKTRSSAVPETTLSSTSSVNNGTGAPPRRMTPEITVSSETSANTGVLPIENQADVHPTSSSSVSTISPPDRVTDLQQSPFPLIFFTKDSEGALHFRALTAALEVRPVTYPFQPDPAMAPLIFDNCVIVRGLLLTIDSTSKKILAFDLHESSRETLQIPRLTEPYGLVLSYGCPYFWSGSLIYEIRISNGCPKLKKLGSTGLTDIRNMRVLRRRDDQLDIAMNVGEAGTAKVVTLSSGSKPKISKQLNTTRWFLGSSKDDFFYIENGRLQSSREGGIAYEIFERSYFKDSFNVGNIVFLRTRVGEVESKVTVVDMLTGKAIHSFTIKGEMKLVETIAR